MGAAFLQFAGGLNGLILPVRGEAEGFSSTSLGLLGTGWAIGYVVGCLSVPAVVGRVGHIRAFGAMCALASISVMMSLLFIDPWVWIPVRAVSGFCFAGAAMIVESWLTEHTEKESRGRIFGIYTMISLTATTAGQMVLTLGESSGYFFFVLAAMIYCLALLPTAISATKTPKPLTRVSLNLRDLWKNSPTSFFGVLMVGVSNAAFGTLAAVYAANMGLPFGEIALFASVPILAGAALQIPVGIASDRCDRRLVLVVIAGAALLSDTIFLFAGFEDPHVLLGLSGIFGATVYSMYPVIVTHANDHAAPGTFIQVSGGLLLLYGIGSIVGPTLAGFAMTSFGAPSLFAVTGIAHILLILFILLRLRTTPTVLPENKGSFMSTPRAHLLTPETAALSTDESELNSDRAQTGTPEQKESLNGNLE
jgi:MFS family permease